MKTAVFGLFLIFVLVLWIMFSIAAGETTELPSSGLNFDDYAIENDKCWSQFKENKCDTTQLTAKCK